ncbi:Macrolide export ATP-binding/permease protein MacB [Enhygromyxa salina]|uniref:Macrolide export ATP-binding/permease protein MacB n=1 Tax=Enhygromyxa salina TaxID=215803 RepID=A0A0C2D453_9BACT|nr:FtsX-like permease family protein [Enhygromyxa salina]KIG14877.1 Macrolide export ATP-binding/permease protein MacB [Enhygromyxa salina]
MRAARLFRIAVDDIRRNRRHFLLASIGIIVGIAAFTFFLALGGGVRKVVLGKIFPLDKLEVVPKSFDVDVSVLRVPLGNEIIDDAKVAQLKAIPSVEAVYPKMKLTIPSMVWGGQKLFGNNLRAELIADGVEPELVRGDIAKRLVFEDFEADATTWDDWQTLPSATPCETNEQCVEAHDEQSYCWGVNELAAWEKAVARAAKAGKAPPPKPIEQPRCRKYIPIIISNHIVELYNGSVRRAHGFPKINPDSAVGFTFDLTFGASMVDASAKDHTYEARGMLVGFSDKAINLGMTFPVGYVRRLNVEFGEPASASMYHSAVLQIGSKDDVAVVAAAVKELNLDVTDTGAEQAALLITIFMMVFGFVSVVIVGIAAINIMHVFFMLIYERQQELGIMRAIGASRGDIRRIIISEAAIVGALAGAVGVALAIAAGRVFDWVSASYIPDFPYKPRTYFEFPLWLLLAAFGFAIGFCVIGAFFPANRAARTDPARVLTGQ